MRRKQIFPLSPGDVFSESRNGVRTWFTVLKVVPPFIRMTMQTTSEGVSQKVYLEGKIYGDWKVMLESRKEVLILDTAMKNVLPQGSEAEECCFVRLNAEAGGVYLLCYHGGRKKIDGFYFRESFKRDSELHLRTEPQGKHGFCYRVFETL